MRTAPILSPTYRFVRIKGLPKDIYLYTDDGHGNSEYGFIAEYDTPAQAKRLCAVLNRTLRDVARARVVRTPARPAQRVRPRR